jgi:hypothetical protein
MMGLHDNHKGHGEDRKEEVGRNIEEAQRELTNLQLKINGIRRKNYFLL